VESIDPSIPSHSMEMFSVGRIIPNVADFRSRFRFFGGGLIDAA